MTIWLFFILVAILFFLGCPVVYSFFAASLVYFFLNDLDVMHAFKIAVNGLYSFILLSAVFFILAARVMNEGKITSRLFDFANRLVGHIPGGLSHVNILSSIISPSIPMVLYAVVSNTSVGALCTRSFVYLPVHDDENVHTAR